MQVDDTSANWMTWNSLYKSQTYTNKFIDTWTIVNKVDTKKRNKVIKIYT